MKRQPHCRPPVAAGTRGNSRGIHPLGDRRAAQGAIEVSQPVNALGLNHTLPKRREIQPEAFADAALGIFNLAVHLVGGDIDKPRRQIGQHRLETYLFGCVLFSPPALGHIYGHSYQRIGFPGCDA